MQAKIRRLPRWVLVALGVAFAIVVAVVAYVGTAAAIRDAGDNAKTTTESGQERVVQDSPIELVAISGADLDRARPKLLDGDVAAFEELRGAGPSAEQYPHSSHYLAFMASHLIDEEVLPDRDWDLSQALYELRGKRLTTVIPRKGVDLADLEPARYDALELRREFHGGGELSDPRAEKALFDAIRVLRTNLEALDEDGALVLLFKP